MKITRQDIDDIIQWIPGDMAVYYVDRGLQSIYYSDMLPALSGLTAEEYDQIIKSDALNIVLKEDHAYVARAVEQCIQTTQERECTYRIRHKERGFIWIHGKARRLGELGGVPVVLIFFFDTSFEVAVHENLLDHSGRSIIVVDKYTWEVLYANKQAVRYSVFGQAGYMGKPCYLFIWGEDKPCERCFMNSPRSADKQNSREWYDPRRKRYFQVVCEAVMWSGREAFVIYLQDNYGTKTAGVPYGQGCRQAGGHSLSPAHGNWRSMPCRRRHASDSGQSGSAASFWTGGGNTISWGAGTYYGPHS